MKGESLHPDLFLMVHYAMCIECALSQLICPSHLTYLSLFSIFIADATHGRRDAWKPRRAGQSSPKLGVSTAATKCAGPTVGPMILYLLVSPSLLLLSFNLFQPPAR